MLIAFNSFTVYIYSSLNLSFAQLICNQYFSQSVCSPRSKLNKTSYQCAHLFKYNQFKIFIRYLFFHNCPRLCSYQIWKNLVFSITLFMSISYCNQMFYQTDYVVQTYPIYRKDALLTRKSEK